VASFDGGVEGARDPVVGGPDADWAFVARASRLIPQLRAQAATSEAQRQILDETIALLDRSELFDITRPRRYGGHGCNVRTFMETIAETARGDGAAGWIVGLINVCTWFGTLFSEQAQAEVFGVNPKARICGSIFAPKGGVQEVEGGYRVSGQWPYCSGSAWSDWATLALTVAERPDGSPIQSLALIPMSDVEIIDTWFVSGMVATASNTIVAKDIFIPHHRIQPLENLAHEQYACEYDDEPNYRVSFVPLATLILAGANVGLARAAMDLTLSQRAGKPVTYTIFKEARQSPAIQAGVAEAASLTDCAALLMARSSADIDLAAIRREHLDLTTRARIRMDTGQIAELGRQAVNRLMTHNGAGAFALRNDLQRVWRDAEIAVRHAQVEPEVAKLTYGQALLGLDRFSTLFF
jgi:alkylation response protein AidB-like acyl-CoA dehydrogenase